MARPAGFRLHRATWKALLEAKGLSTSDVADLSGVAAKTIESLRTDHRRASAPVAHRIAEAVGVPAEVLFPELSGHFVATPKAA